MRKIILLCFLLPLLATAQPIFPPATQAEVDAGILRSKFVSPATLAGWTGVGSVTNTIRSATGLGTNTSFYGAITNNGSLRQVGATYLTSLATNSLVYIGAGGILHTTILGANLSWSAPGTLAAAGGSGDVTKVGTPVDNQVGIWTGDGIIEGSAELTYDAGVLQILEGNTPGFQVIRTSTATNIYRADEMVAYGSSYNITVGSKVISITQARVAIPTNLNVNGFIHSASGLIPSNSVPRFNTGTNIVASGVNIDNSTNISGIQSLHAVGPLTATEINTTNAAPGSSTAALTLSATNLTQAVRIQGAHQMTRLVTNIIGILEVATNDIASAVFTIDCDKQHEVNMTNRIGFAFTAMVTNGVPGQRIKGRFIGTASGGANHIVTFAGQGLFLNSYDISANPATSLAVTVTNGYLLEYDIAINKDNGTNTFDTIYAYKKY